MKKLYYIFIFYFLTSGISYSQGLINNHWKLGSLDLNFSTDPLTVNSSSNTNYGHATISDNSGNLLFYTDGVKVWNKNHNAMNNGSQIGTAISPYQKCVIVPHPGNANKYYIFNTRTDWFLNNGQNPSGGYMLSYSLVDFTNNPLGELVPVNTQGGGFFPYVQNLTGLNLPNVLTSYKPLTVAKNNNNTGFFVITQNYDNMISFKVDENGLNESPIISTFQNKQIYNVPKPFGTLILGIQKSMIRISPDGLKLVGLESSGYQNDIVHSGSHLYSLNFNNQTGQFTNYQDRGWYTLTDNFEFSSNSQYVYMVRKTHPMFSGGNLDGEIIVKDLADPSQTVRRLTVFNMPSTYSSKLSFLQRDRYDNLWISSGYSDSDRNKYLHKIENQNSFTNSSVKLNEISLNMATYLELPQLILTTQQGCENDVYLTSPEANSVHTYHYSDNITSGQNYTVNPGQNITMKAGNFISMKPNTHIKSGATFLAKIEECANQIIAVHKQKDAGLIGMKDLNQKDIITLLYPNPNKGIFSIALGRKFSGTTFFRVFDISGKLVYKGSSNEHSFDVHIPNLSSGMYIIKLSSDSYSETIKFIKQ